MDLRTDENHMQNFSTTIRFKSFTKHLSSLLFNHRHHHNLTNCTMNPAFVSSTPLNFRQTTTSIFSSSSISKKPFCFPQNLSNFSSNNKKTGAARLEATAAVPEASVPSSTSWPDLQQLSQTECAMSTVLNTEQVMKILPHRYPFLLLDRVIAVEAGKRAIGVKSVTINEPFFPGHFPNRPIMPGVLQVEALAQLGGIVMLQPPFVEEGMQDVDFFFGGVDNVKWRRPVIPGDTLVMEMTLNSFKKSFGIAKMSGRAFVNGELVVEGIFKLVMVMDKK